MNSWILVILLAILQGVTEFLPVSSSGHLALLSNLFALPCQEGTALGIVLHAGSLLAMVAYYFRVLSGFFKKEQLHLLFMVIIGSIPVFLLGFFMVQSNFIDLMFGDMISVAMGFLITASILRLSGKEKLRSKSNTELKDISLKQAITVGISQALAIIPGISRSGTTIAAGILSGIKFEAAATFSFLLAIPAIAGASVMEITDLSRQGFQLGNFNTVQLITAFLISAAASFASLTLLVKIIRKQKLDRFSWYMFLLGASVMIWQILTINKG